MTRRVQVLWLPAVASILAAEATLFLLTWAGVRPWTVPLDWHVFHSHHPLQFYVPWLVALPFIAAAAVLFSRRRGGTAREAAVAAMAPAVAALALTAVATPIDLLVDVGGGKHAAEHTFCGTAWLLVSFVLAPGVALVLGLLAAGAWRRRAEAAGSTTHPLGAQG
ncbi:MAG TPA: hypothetical protein VLL75_06885 [Vicinamibacteria bacterium]|nr:hypothetical protein [Vicinamibacteria bacterium]